jgi:hypothetical protein
MGSFSFLYYVLSNQQIPAKSLVLEIYDKFEPSKSESVRTTTGQLEILLSERGSERKVCVIPLKITFNGYLSKWKETFRYFNFDRTADEVKVTPPESEDSFEVSSGFEMKIQLFRLENESSIELKSFKLEQILGDYKPVTREIKDANQKLVSSVVFQSKDGITLPIGFEQSSYDMSQTTLVSIEGVKADAVQESSESIEKYTENCKKIGRNTLVQLRGE